MMSDKAERTELCQMKPESPPNVKWAILVTYTYRTELLYHERKGKNGLDFSSFSRVASVPQGNSLGPILFTSFSATMDASLTIAAFLLYAVDA
ncbi:hypothetical protein J6590_092639 [Homalodisca vitripennis]|nr:hypothetical protein J6590_092639 [Homalodisca vitripennis]